MLTLGSRNQPIHDRKPMGVKGVATEGGGDHWNHPWSRANSLLAYHAARGRRIFTTDEPGTEGWRAQLRGLGWQEKPLEEIPFHMLLMPPSELLGADLCVKQVQEGRVPGLLFEVDVPDQRDHDYQVLLASISAEHLASLDVTLMATVLVMDDWSNLGTARTRSKMVAVWPR